MPMINLEDNDEITEEIVDDIDEVIEDSEPEFNIDDVLQRFEQAKLYSTLLKHKLFSDGSADQTIIDNVENEIKTFVVKRMRILMGVETDTVNESVSPIKVELPFNDQEIQALKSIANRLIEKRQVSESNTEPRLNKVEVPAEQTQIITNTVKANTLPQNTIKPENKTVTNKQVTAKKKIKDKNGQTKTKTVVIKPPTPEEGNRGSDGANYAQALPNSQRLPMPSPTQQAAMVAAEVMKTSTNFNSGSNALTQLLNLAAKDAINKNSHLPDEE